MRCCAITGGKLQMAGLLLVPRAHLSKSEKVDAYGRVQEQGWEEDIQEDVRWIYSHPEGCSIAQVSQVEFGCEDFQHSTFTQAPFEDIRYKNPCHNYHTIHVNIIRLWQMVNSDAHRHLQCQNKQRNEHPSSPTQHSPR